VEAMPNVKFLCPFCNMRCFATVNPEPSVIHELPMCKTFDSLEPDAFIAAVNVAIATKRGVGLS
jgi:hypothetical protein